MKTKISSSALAALLEGDSAQHADVLDRIAADHPADSALLFRLVGLAESCGPEVQVAVTGLLRRYQASGAVFSPRLTGRLIDLIPAVARWEARLHLLQMLPALAVPRHHADPVCEHLSGLLTDRNKFVRAWAYGGLHRLASLHPRYCIGVATLLNRSSIEESASVRARLRQLPPLRSASARPGARQPPP